VRLEDHGVQASEFIDVSVDEPKPHRDVHGGDVVLHHWVARHVYAAKDLSAAEQRKLLVRWRRLEVAIIEVGGQQRAGLITPALIVGTRVPQAGQPRPAHDSEPQGCRVVTRPRDRVGRVLEVGQRRPCDLTRAPLGIESHAREIATLAGDLRGSARIVEAPERAIEGEGHLAKGQRIGGDQTPGCAHPPTLADHADVLGSTLDLQPNRESSGRLTIIGHHGLADDHDVGRGLDRREVALVANCARLGVTVVLVDVDERSLLGRQFHRPPSIGDERALDDHDAPVVAVGVGDHRDPGLHADRVGDDLHIPASRRSAGPDGAVKPLQHPGGDRGRGVVDRAGPGAGVEPLGRDVGPRVRRGRFPRNLAEARICAVAEAAPRRGGSRGPSAPKDRNP